MGLVIDVIKLKNIDPAVCRSYTHTVEIISFIELKPVWSNAKQTTMQHQELYFNTFICYSNSNLRFVISSKTSEKVKVDEPIWVLLTSNTKIMSKRHFMFVAKGT